jgi:hypothetical protein
MESRTGGRTGQPPEAIKEAAVRAGETELIQSASLSRCMRSSSSKRLKEVRPGQYFCTKSPEQPVTGDWYSSFLIKKLFSMLSCRDWRQLNVFLI